MAAAPENTPAQDAALVVANAQVKATAFNNAELQQQIQMIIGLKDNDPDLQKAWDAYQKGDVDAFRAAILASAFYKNNNALARQRASAKANQFGVWEQDLAAYKSATKRRLASVGVQWNSSIEAQVSTAYNSGLADNALDDLLASSGVIGELGGSTLGSVTALKTYANQFGVSNLYNKDYWDNKASQIFSGSITADDIQKEIRDLSASAFPAYADGIANGKTLAAQGSNVIQTVSTFLEKDPDTLSFDDPTVRKIMQYTDPVTGKPAIMPQWQVERIVKSDPKWGETNNARDTIDSLSYKVLRDWGLA